MSATAPPEEGQPEFSTREKPPLFSIITVCRNSAETIRETAAGLLGQRFADWEWVVVDGASEDGTVDIIRETAAGDPRLRLISEPDTGIYHAMNKGVARARGEYVHFLNADDRYVDENVLGDVAAALSARPDIDFLYGNIQVCDAAGNQTLHRPLPVERVLEEFVAGCLPHQGSFARRALFAEDAVGLFNETLRIASDYQWMMTAVTRPGVCLHYLDRVIADFSTTGVSSQLEKSLPEAFGVLNSHTAFLEAMGVPRLLRAYQSNMLATRVEMEKLRAEVAKQTAGKLRAKAKLAEATRLRDEYKRKLKERTDTRRPRASWLPSWLKF